MILFVKKNSKSKFSRFRFFQVKNYTLPLRPIYQSSILIANTRVIYSVWNLNDKIYYLIYIIYLKFHTNKTSLITKITRISLFAKNLLQNFQISPINLVDTRPKVNVHKTFILCPESSLNALSMLNFGHASFTEYWESYLNSCN